MSTPPPPEDGIDVAVTSEFSVARVRGRGSFKTSGALKRFISSTAERSANPVLIDFQDCIGLDSTFMGVMAGLSFKLKQLERPRLQLVNLSERNNKLIHVLGLHHLVDISANGVLPGAYSEFLAGGGPLDRLERPEEDRKDTARLMLEAHQTLVDISEDNRPKFQDVLTYLREELGETE